MKKTENQSYNTSERILKHPRLVIAGVALITVFFALQLTRTGLDNNNLRFVPEGDEARLVSAWIDKTFGSSLFILVGLQKKYGTVLEADFLKQIKIFSKEIEQIETVGTVNSIMTTDYITGDGDSIIVENLVSDSWSGTPQEILELKQRLLSWDMYDRSLVSDDWKAVQIYIPLNIDAENAGYPEVVASYLQIRDMASTTFKDSATVYVTGMPVISGTINESMKADLVYLIPIIIILILFILYLPIRNLYFVALSLLSVVIATVWAMGAMPLFDIKLSIICTVLPVILIAVGNSYGLHIIVHYMSDSGKDFSNMTRDEHTQFIFEIMRTVRRPIFLATITTLASFLSFCVTNVMPIREFGYFSAFGVAASFILAIFLTPAILILRGPKPLRQKVRWTENTNGIVSYNDKISNFLVRITNRKWFVIFIVMLIVGVSLYGSTKLVIDNIFVEYFKSSTDIVRSDKFIRDKFGGSKIISIVAEADTPQELLHPESLCAIDNLNTYLLENIPIVGKVMGFTDLIKRTNQVFNSDESPTGIQAVSYNEDDVSDSDSDFGFGFDTDNINAESDKAPVPYSTQPAFQPPLDTAALYELLDKAAGANKKLNVNEFVRELKKINNYQGLAFYEIPEDPARYGKKNKEELQRLISNYLILLSANSDSYSNDPLEPTAIKSTVQLKALGEIDTNFVVKHINQYVKDNFPANIKVTVGGIALVEGSTNRSVVQSVWSSILIAFVSLFIILSIVNRSILAGVIGIVPLCALILVNFAVMGFTGIKLNIGTAMISSLTLGIGIDYTVHFLEAYKREIKNGGNFMFRAYRTSGIAIVADAVSTAMGFAVLLFSRFVVLADFGLLIAVSLLLSAVVGLIVIPVLLNLIKPKFIFKPE